MVAINIDPNYGYVLLAATSTFILNTIHGVNTGKYRKAAKVDYPACYAPSSRTDTAANQFNCAQRAHANFTENHVSALVPMLLAGLQYPIPAAAMGAGWSVSRYLYMTGYSTGGNGRGRYNGATFWLFQFGLMGLTAYSGLSLIMGW